LSRATLADLPHQDGEPEPRAHLHAHLVESRAAVDALESHLDTISAWAETLAEVLVGGGRLLVAGNGGSAALAHHLVAELVGRYRDDRAAYAALALTADTSILTALGNDFGYDNCFVRQIAAYGRRGDVLLAMSTSGRSANLLKAAEAARCGGLRCWALTGPSPNPLAATADAIMIDAATAAAVQEAQQVVVHLLCTAFDLHVTPRG
jgi:D-sedoheptulose 7-phosphate isomerase